VTTPLSRGVSVWQPFAQLSTSSPFAPDPRRIHGGLNRFDLFGQLRPGWFQAVGRRSRAVREAYLYGVDIRRRSRVSSMHMQIQAVMLYMDVGSWMPAKLGTSMLICKSESRRGFPKMRKPQGGNSGHCPWEGSRRKAGRQKRKKRKKKTKDKPAASDAVVDSDPTKGTDD
jgi:hypothetical protein